MSKPVRVTLTGDYDHGVHGEQRVFRAGDHMLPIAIARAAHAQGLVDGPAPVEKAEPPARDKAPAKRVRKPKAKPVTSHASAKAFPAAKPAKKPAAKAKA